MHTPNATDLLLRAPETQVLRMRRVIAHLVRGAWCEAAALLVLVARDTPDTQFGQDCETLAREMSACCS